MFNRLIFHLLLILFAVQLLSQPTVSTNQNLIKLKSYLSTAKRSAEYHDFRTAFNYYKRIIEIDWLYENSIHNYLVTAIKSGAVKEAETGLLKIYTPYRDQKISAVNQPETVITSVLAVFYLSTARDQLAEEFIAVLKKSGIPIREKTTLIADIYDQSGRQDLALSILESGRKTLNNMDLFAWQFYQLYLKKNEYLSAGKELIKHIDNISAAKNRKSDSQELQTAEAELIKLIELASLDETSEIISIIEINTPKNHYFYKVLSSVYFTLKEYGKSFENFKRSPSMNFDNNTDYLVFARELYGENELDFAIVYYEKYFANSANIPLNVQDFFNYINLLFQKGKKQQALTILESASLPALINPVLLDLFKADVFLYTLKQPSISEKIIDKYINNSDLPGLMAKKMRRDISAFQQDFKTALRLNDELLVSDLAKYSTELLQNNQFARILLLLLNGNFAEFKAKAVESVGRKKGTDTDNDLLTILQDYQQVEDQPAQLRVFLHFVNFKLHKQPDYLLDSLKSTPVVQLSPASFQKILYEYLKETDISAAKKIVSTMISKSAQSVNLPYFIFDSAKLDENNPDSYAENTKNLIYLIKNYPKSLYLEPSRKLLRKTQSRRPGGVTPKL